MWDLAIVPWPGMEPGPRTWGAWSVIHWTTRDVPWVPLILGSSPASSSMVTLALTPLFHLSPSFLRACVDTLGPPTWVTQDHLPVLKTLTSFQCSFCHVTQRFRRFQGWGCGRLWGHYSAITLLFPKTGHGSYCLKRRLRSWACHFHPMLSVKHSQIPDSRGGDVASTHPKGVPKNLEVMV